MALSVLERIKIAQGKPTVGYRQLATSAPQTLQVKSGSLLSRVQSAFKSVASKVGKAIANKPQPALQGTLTQQGKDYLSNIGQYTQVGKPADVSFARREAQGSPLFELSGATEYERKFGRTPESGEVITRYAGDFLLPGVTRLPRKVLSDIAKSDSIEVISNILRPVIKNEEQVTTLAKVLKNTTKPEKVKDLLLSQESLSTRVKGALSNKPINKYKVVNTSGAVEDVIGEPVKIFDGIDTFINKDENGNWVVSEATTGRMITSGGFENPNFAINNARDNIKLTGEEEVKRLIAETPVIKPPVATISDATDPLIQEARKYKSAEEFVREKTQAPPKALWGYESMANKYKTVNDFEDNVLQPSLATDAGEKYKDVGFRLDVKDIDEISQSYSLQDYEMKTAKSMARSIKNGKEIPPIIVDKNGTIIDGNHRYEAYRMLGQDEIPVLIVDDSAIAGRVKNVDEFFNNATNKDYKSQLEEIWKKANKVETKPALPKKKVAPKAPKPSVVQKPVQKVEPQPKKVGSVIEQAEQVLQKVDEPVKKEVSSLPKIIAQTPTDVKNKVNILDYARTPDRVLEKIGFKAEADKLRKGYEAYVKELPDNLDIITKWSQRVPKESNQKIFKYLDGQEVELNETELEVANEIKDWLADWAKRLKLPEDNRIAHYITHIFEKGIIQKEFDEELAKIIAERVPGSVYDPFLLKRLGKLGYKEDTWAALDAYVKRATRKANLDDALEAINEKTGGTLELSNIEASQFKYIQRYINNVNLRPTELDNLIDNTIKSFAGYKLGQRPVVTITRLLRQMTYRGMLGLNPGSALRNLSQGINTYAVLGEKYTAIGYAKLFNKGAINELNDSGILSPGFIQDRALSATKKSIERVDKVLFSFFDLAEKINRGSAYFGAKAKAINAGKTEEEAIEYAKSIVRKTQFSFGSIDTPVALQNDIVKTLTQFQTFTIKQIEFLTELAKDKNFAGLLRYAVAGLAFVYTIGKAFGMEPKELIPQFRIGTPPSLKLPVEATKAALDVPDKYGRKRTLSEKASDVSKAAIGLIPGGTQIKKTIEGYKAQKEGVSKDKGGREQFKVGETPLKKVQAAVFGKYAGESAKKYFAGDTMAEQEYERLSKSDNAAAEFDKIIKEDPALAKRILKVKEDKDLGITDEEKKIRAMGVGSGERATAVVKRLDKLKTKEEKAKLYDEYVKKKIITKEVAELISIMMSEEGRKSNIKP